MSSIGYLLESFFVFLFFRLGSCGMSGDMGLASDFEWETLRSFDLIQNFSIPEEFV